MEDWSLEVVGTGTVGHPVARDSNMEKLPGFVRNDGFKCFYLSGVQDIGHRQCSFLWYWFVWTPYDVKIKKKFPTTLLGYVSISLR